MYEKCKMLGRHDSCLDGEDYLELNKGKDN